MKKLKRSKINISKSQEQGAVMLLLAALIVVLLGVLGFAHFSTTQKIIKEELQTAADVASMAATKELCPSTACWDQARLTALESLKTQTVRNYFGQAKPIIPKDTDVSTLTFSIDPLELQGYVTDINGIKIKIDRGHWIDLESGNAEFDSLELDENNQPWNGTFKGVPNWMTANGVNVAIVVPTTFDFLLSKDISGPIAVRAFAESTSVIGQGNIVADCVAPFAIPICALLDRNNQFDQNRNCNADRIFTRADRYCDKINPNSNDADDCEIRPGFFYNFEQPVPLNVLNNASSGNSDDDGIDNSMHPNLSPSQITTECKVNTENPRPLAAYRWIDQTNMPIGDTSKIDLSGDPVEISEENIPTGWCNPTFDSVQDHFGVIGYLDSDRNDGSTRPELKMVLERMQSCKPARVGDTFKIIKNGFDDATENIPSEVESAVARNMSLRTSSPVTNRDLPPLPNPLLSPLPIEPAVAEISSADIVPAGGYVLVSDLPVGPEPLPSIEDSATPTPPPPTPTMGPTPTPSPKEKKYCFSDNEQECPMIPGTKQYNCQACNCSTRRDYGLTSPIFYDNAQGYYRTVEMNCEWEYSPEIDQCAQINIDSENDAEKCELACDGTYTCSPHPYSCNYYRKSGEFACEVSPDCLRQCQEVITETETYPDFPSESDTKTEISEPIEDGKFQPNLKALSSEDLIVDPQVPNQLLRSAQNAGLCRSLRAELKCAQIPDSTPTPSPSYTENERLLKLNYNSAHYPDQVILQSIPAPDPATPLADHICNLNKGYKLNQHLTQVEQDLVALQQYCASENHSIEPICKFTDLKKVPIQEDLSPNTPHTEGIYTNLKPTLRAPQYQDGYWYTKIPIIADFSSNAKDCSSDPAINPQGDWKIVGFVDGQIFDADVTGAIAKDHWGNEFTEDPNSKNGPFPVLDQTDGQIKNGPTDWYFSTDGNEPDPCNMIRARMACQSSFVATPQDSFDAKTMPPVLRK